MTTNPSPRLHRPYYRNGNQHRSGADVSFVDIVKIFNFRRIQIGKWVTKEEQQIAANLFFDALCDLMEILQVPERVISLNGTLSLAFGTGGSKHSCAHYSPEQRLLALAKNAGGGALAHEWFHAFDHYISDKMFNNKQRKGFASDYWLNDQTIATHPLNEALSRCFHCIFLSEDGKDVNQYVAQSVRADKALNMFYYAQPQEMAARAFEAMVQDNPIKNNFLVLGTKQSAEAKLGIYPVDQHRNAINQAFMHYFILLGKSLSKQQLND